jgi:hypothetical protein
LWHLGRTPIDRDRLIAEPALMPTAIEEFLRAFSPVTMAREVVKDTEIGGCPIKAGNMVLLSFPAASRIKAVISPLAWPCYMRCGRVLRESARRSAPPRDRLSSIKDVVTLN